MLRKFIKDSGILKKSISAEHLDGNLKVTKKSLIKILDKEEIGKGGSGTVYRARIKVGNKIKNFAIKYFRKDFLEMALEQSISTYNDLLKRNISTWATYRRLDGENAVLMTLGAGDGGVIFSANNKSEHTEFLKKNKINNIGNISEFYDNSLSNLISLTMGSKGVFFDSYMFNYKDGELNVLLGDFDGITTLDLERNELISYNIMEYCYALLRCGEYFDMGEELFKKFTYYLLNKQENKNKYIQNVDLEKIYNEAYDLYMSGKPK